MRGLTVRWSLTDAPDGVEEQLAGYVSETSHARFTGKASLCFKTWRVRPGEWFEGTYVFESAEAREDSEREFTAVPAESPGSQITGSAPVLVEPFDVVAIAEGPSGFAPRR